MLLRGVSTVQKEEAGMDIRSSNLTLDKDMRKVELVEGGLAEPEAAC